MRGIATIDREPNGVTAATWVTSRGGLNIQHANAVVVDLTVDPRALEKVRSLTRRCAVLTTRGSTLDGFSVDGEPLTVDDVDSLVLATEARQAAIVDAVAAYRRAIGSKTQKDPVFPRKVDADDFEPTDATASARAFATANYLAKAWDAWLRTDEERRRRATNPRGGEPPWMMPADLSAEEVEVFPAAFAAKAFVQPLV